MVCGAFPNNSDLCLLSFIFQLDDAQQLSSVYILEYNGFASLLNISFNYVLELFNVWQNDKVRTAYEALRHHKINYGALIRDQRKESISPEFIDAMNFWKE